MSLRFMDSFGHYATADGVQKWTSFAASIVASAGRRTGQSIVRVGNSQAIAKGFNNKATWIVGVAFKPTAVVDLGFLTIDDGATNQIALRITSTNQWAVYRGNSVQLGSNFGTYVAGNWHYVEIKTTIDNSVGAVAVRINSSTLLNLTGVDTQNTANAYANSIALRGQVGVGTIWDFCDLYICDGDGSVNNDFLGDVRVDYLKPTAEGNTTQWTPSTGTDNALNVDDATPNADTDYNSSSTVGQKDTYIHENLPSSVGSVKGLQWLAYVRKDDAGARSIAPVVRHSGTDYDGTDQAIGDSYTYYTQMYENNPGTATAWTPTEVDNAEFGIKLTV